MAEAEIAKRPKREMIRNGLMIALLAYCPIRLKNFAALEIGRSFVNVDGMVDCTHGSRNQGKEGRRAASPESSQIKSNAIWKSTSLCQRGAKQRLTLSCWQ